MGKNAQRAKDLLEDVKMYNPALIKQLKKDGTIRTPATAEVEITCTSILAKGDTMLDKLESALDNDKWELKTVWGVGYKFEVRQ